MYCKFQVGWFEKYCIVHTILSMARCKSIFSHHLISVLHMNEAEVKAIPKVNSIMTKEEKEKQKK